MMLQLVDWQIMNLLKINTCVCLGFLFFSLHIDYVDLESEFWNLFSVQFSQRLHLTSCVIYIHPCLWNKHFPKTAIRGYLARCVLLYHKISVRNESFIFFYLSRWSRKRWIKTVKKYSEQEWCDNVTSHVPCFRSGSDW